MPLASDAKVTFINTLGLRLKLKSKSLDHGGWITNPPEIIEPLENGYWESGSNIAGNQGEVVYEFMHREGSCTLTVKWDIPFIGSNSCRGWVDLYDYQILSSGSSGYSANFTFKLVEGKSVSLWYTEVDNIWDNSYNVITNHWTTYPGHLVPYKEDLFCFYKSDIYTYETKSDIFYVIKDRNGPSWSNKSCHIKDLGNDNQYLTAVSVEGRYILIACLSKHDRIQTIDFQYDDQGKITYSNHRFFPDLGPKSTNYSLVVFYNNIMLFFVDKDSVINYVVISEKGDKYLSKEQVKYWPGCPYQKSISTSVDPKAIVYEGLLYLIYTDHSRKDGWYYITYNKEKWSFPTRFTNINYEYSPGLAIHNGLLKVAFIGKIYNEGGNGISDRVIYQYCYDGTSWSHSVPSSSLSAGYSVNMATCKNKFFAVYNGMGFEGITDNTVRPRD